jgi:hypothetical protein
MKLTQKLTCLFFKTELQGDVKLTLSFEKYRQSTQAFSAPYNTFAVNPFILL